MVPGTWHGLICWQGERKEGGREGGREGKRKKMEGRKEGWKEERVGLGEKGRGKTCLGRESVPDNILNV